MPSPSENLTVASEEYDVSNEEIFRFEIQDLLSILIQDMTNMSGGVGMQSISRHAKLKHVLPTVGISTYG